MSTTPTVLKAALEAYSGPQALDPQQYLFRYRFPNGTDVDVSHSQACGAALKRIEELERETSQSPSVLSDDFVKRGLEYAKTAKWRGIPLSVMSYHELLAITATYFVDRQL